ncbi:ADP-ribosylglycohydrolase [Enterococcus sp. PF1-24]|uniref:ADP-ribosylglycohydrolase family protein n=1 Tax=unclassified Enterococcus TaxID=2608891 RepID=UPI0024746732|nr:MULTISPECIES: ADP-ribosylglycohydrolase family protein [unclassified Enterococcus]MDH6363907.1 ADP-ribosylglycohydrolase [Enterococcus sp. PFB1-1]MDH6400907.1 ADP-ribosylglycohydrolase [Enterococcus sp. PF1-24]
MNKEKMLGALYGAAVGDALGAPTELRNTTQILATFGDYVKEYTVSPDDTFARDYPAGTVTDDFSMSYYLMGALIDNQGTFNEKIAQQAIINWGTDERYFDKFAGPTTRAAIENMKQNLPTDIDPFGLINYNSLATNGGAMKTIPLAVAAQGNLETALAYTIDMCKPTHFNSNAISAAAAICCAATTALTSQATLDTIIEAALWGAQKGKVYGEEQQHISVGPDIAYKIQEAVKIGKQAKNFQQLLQDTANKVGTNFIVQESIPAVFSLLVGVKGQTMEGLYAAANVGGDTDTIASMLGGILGGLNGLASIPPKYIETMTAANSSLAIQTTVAKFVDLYL